MGKITRQELTPTLQQELDDVQNYIDGSNNVAYNEHLVNTSNPHLVTASHVGLGSVDNVQQAPKVDFDLHVSSSNPHNITPAMIGSVPTSRLVSSGTGLTGGGALSSSQTLSFDVDWGDTRYLRSNGGVISGVFEGGHISSRLTHNTGYFDIFPYSPTYDNGSYAQAYWDGNDLVISKRDSAGRHDMGIKLNGERVHSTKTITHGTSNPSGGVNGDIYIKY